MKNRLKPLVQLIFAELFSIPWVMAIIGFCARLMYGRRLTTVALFYPANRRYLESISYPWYARHVKWKPRLGGFFVTSHGCGFLFAIGALEEEFSNLNNRAHLLAVHESMARFASILRIKSVSYSGVLPSVLAKHGVDRHPIEIVRTSHWIIDAIEAAKQKCKLPMNCPLVVLGSAGFLGQRVVRLIWQNNADQQIVEIDPMQEDQGRLAIELFSELRGRPILLVNISRQDVLERYIDHLWDGVVVLNEVYPECSKDGINRMKMMGVRYLHIQGVKAWSIPSFPGAYKGAVPCCAASAANADIMKSRFTAEIKLLEE